MAPPAALVVILLGWQVASPRDWRFSPSILPVMLLESCVLAVALVGVSRLIDLGFSVLDRNAPPVLSVVSSPARTSLTPLIGYLGRASTKKRCSASSWFRSSLLCSASANPPGPGQCAGGDRLGAALLAGPPRGHARRGLHLVRLCLSLDGGSVLRLGVRDPRLWHRGRHAHGVRYPRRLGGLAPLICPPRWPDSPEPSWHCDQALAFCICHLPSGLSNRLGPATPHRNRNR